MRKIRRTWIVIAGSVVLATGAYLPTAAQASTYSPGKSTPHKPVYNAYTGKWNYYCSFSGWRSGALVQWHCELHSRYFDELGFLVDENIAPKKTGTWTPPPSTHTTPTYTWPLDPGQGQLCTETWALSVDGGNNTKIACN